MEFNQRVKEHPSGRVPETSVSKPGSLFVNVYDDSRSQHRAAQKQGSVSMTSIFHRPVPDVQMPTNLFSVNHRSSQGLCLYRNDSSLIYHSGSQSRAGNDSR
jgi:hypothetical protein